MSGSEEESTTIRVAGGPCPGPRPAMRTSRPRGWRMLFVAACAASLVAPVGFIATGCSSKPAVKKKAKGTAKKRAETGLAELAGTAGTEAEVPSAPPEPAGAAGDPAVPSTGADVAPTEGVATDSVTDRAAPSDMPESPSAEKATPPPEAEPPSVAADSPAPSLGALSAAGAENGNRPTSKLVDADTALLLDGGRVEVCSPLGWTRSPRSQNYLVRYQPGPKKSYPSIVVTAEPAPEGLGEITAANQPDLVAAIGTMLAQTFPAGGPVKLIKKPAAATFGPHAGVTWAMPGTAKVGGLSEPVDRFASGVVLGGRLYTVEARAPKGKVDDDAKAAAKAVAATLFRPEGAPAGQPEASPNVGAAATAE